MAHQLFPNMDSTSAARNNLCYDPLEDTCRALQCCRLKRTMMLYTMLLHIRHPEGSNIWRRLLPDCSSGSAQKDQVTLPETDGIQPLFPDIPDMTIDT